MVRVVDFVKKFFKFVDNFCEIFNPIFFYHMSNDIVHTKRYVVDKECIFVFIF